MASEAKSTNTKKTLFGTVKVTTDAGKEVEISIPDYTKTQVFSYIAFIADYSPKIIQDSFNNKEDDFIILLKAFKKSPDYEKKIQLWSSARKLKKAENRGRTANMPKGTYSYKAKYEKAISDLVLLQKSYQELEVKYSDLAAMFGGKVEGSSSAPVLDSLKELNEVQTDVESFVEGK